MLHCVLQGLSVRKNRDQDMVFGSRRPTAETATVVDVPFQGSGDRAGDRAGDAGDKIIARQETTDRRIDARGQILPHNQSDLGYAAVEEKTR